jgi:hypothetical protein
MTVGIRQMRVRPQREAVDAIETRARHLHQTKPRCDFCHARRESHRDKDIDIGQLWDDGGLVAND